MTLLYMLFAGVSSVVFAIVSGMFTLIDDLSKYNFFSADTINQFTNRVYVIIGVLMLFKLVISAVQYIVNPDMFDDKSKGLGAVLKKSIIAVVLLAIVPSIFQFAMEVQGDIVEQIPKIIFGNNNSTVDQIGDQLSVSVMNSFLVIKDEKTGLPTKVLNSPMDFYAVAMDGCSSNFLAPDFWSGGACYYNVWWILLVPIAGVFMVYILASMAFDVATRSIKFGIVQILAPIPITSYIVDEKKLTNWATTSVHIYTDLFIRLGLIYLVIYIMQVVLKDMFTSTGYEAFKNSVSQSVGRTPEGVELVLIKILIIVALLLFAKNAPKFIADLLGLKGAGDGFNDMFKRAGGLFGTTMAGIRTARSNYATQRERFAGKGKGRGRQIAEGLRSAAAGFASETGRGLFMSAQGKGFRDVRNGAFKKTIEARNRRIDRVDNLYDDEYGYGDYRRDVRRERLGIPSSEGFIKARYDAMQNIAKLAADSKSHGVGKMNETPDRYKISIVDSSGKGKDDASEMIRSALGFDSLSMEQVRNMYTMARNGQQITHADGVTKVQLSDAQISALGSLVQTIEKRTSYLKEAELMGTGDPAASPNVDKLVMAIKNNGSMFNAPEIMTPIIEKMRKYGVRTSKGDPVTDVSKLLDVVSGLQKPLNRADFASDADYFREVSKRADVLNFVKDSFEEIAKQQYKGAEIADSRAKKAQQAINNNDKKS